MKEKIVQIIEKNSVLSKTLTILISAKNSKKTKPKKFIRGTNNILNIDNSVVLYNCTFNIDGNNNEIEIKKSSILKNVTFFIRGDNNKIKIGQSVQFKNGGSIWIEDYKCEAIIGEGTTFENSHIAVTEPNSKIHIGKDCMFAYDIDLRTGDSHSIIDSITNERINYAQDIIIGNHVWVASHVSILKGVHIACNSIVATRAVVTKSFTDNNILIGGMPAKKLKENVNWDRQRIYK